jgi:hypothetical protein
LRSNQLFNRRCCASQLLQHHGSRLLLHKPVCQSPFPFTSHTRNLTIILPSPLHQKQDIPSHTLRLCRIQLRCERALSGKPCPAILRDR